MLGGARVVTMLFGVGRVKVLAILLGPLGVGLFGTYETIIQAVIYTTTLGVWASGVRQVAQARSTKDTSRIGKTVLTLRRLSWVLGILGSVTLAALCLPISRLTFKTADYAFGLLLLSPVILLQSLYYADRSFLQGMQHISTLALLTVVVAGLDAVAIIALVALLGEHGIVPSLIAAAVITLLSGRWFAKRIEIPEFVETWKKSIGESGIFIRLGLGLTSTLLLSTLVAYATRALIARDMGLGTVGVYLCAFTLSGKFIGFILDAMRMDFYPRLSAVADDNEALNRLINQQTEIVLLIAMPGLLATMTLAPWLVRLFYSEAFMDATPLLHWFIFGCLFRVIWAPMGYLRLAKGMGLLYFLSEAFINVVHLILIYLLLKFFSIIGVAYAYSIYNILHTLMLVVISKRLSSFRWTNKTATLLFGFVILTLLALLASCYLGEWEAAIMGSLTTVVVSIFCLAQLVNRLGPNHRITLIAHKIPGLNRFIP
jgi:PST family polysaccharide transporter